MGLDAPFMYAPIDKTAPNAPYKPFDPHAISRASMEPKPRKPKQEGPYIKLNAHPDSHIPMRTSLMPRISQRLKNNIHRTRTAVMAFRIVQFVGALLALTMMILIRTPITTATIWIMRIAPGLSSLHSLYAIYHLARHPSGRTPASSASYMLFAVTFDVAVIACYVLGGYTAFWEWDPQGVKEHETEEQWTTWASILSDAAPKTDIARIFKMCVTLAFCITGFFHLITLGLSIWLFQMFRVIMRLPPDANPLDDNSTSRQKHKRNKSSIATESTWDDDGKSARFSQYTQGTNRNSRYSGSVHQDFQPPRMPFMHTRTGSSSSVDSHTDIPVGTSPRDSRMDLPSRTYGIPYAGSQNNSQIDLNSKRQSIVSLGNGNRSQSPPKRGSYAAVPQVGEQQWMSQSDREAKKAAKRKSMPNIAGKSTRAAPLGGGSPVRTPRPLSNYGSRYGRYDGDDSGHDSDIGNSVVSRLTDPLSSHPVGKPAKQAQSPQRIPPPQRESALSQMTLNRMNTVATQASSVYSTDELGNPSNSDLSQTKKFDGDDLEELEREREQRRWEGGNGRQLTPSPKKRGNAYAELRNSGMGEVPQLVGRNVSTGNDLGLQKGYRREVSGAVAEEGRGGPASGWGARFRKVSGLGQAQ